MTSCDVASVTNKRKRSRVKGGKKAKNSKNLKKGGKEEDTLSWTQSSSSSECR